MLGRSGQNDLSTSESWLSGEPSARRPGAIGKATRASLLAADGAGAARPPLFSGEASWEAIEPDAPALEGEPAGEEVDPADGEALAQLDAAAAAGAAPDGAGAEGEGAEAEALAPGDAGGAAGAAGAADAAEDGASASASASAMPADAIELGPDPARAAAASDGPGGSGAAQLAGAPHHRGPYERTVARASGHDAEQDRYNRGGVRSRRVTSSIQINRPGLRVGNRDEFHLRGDYAYRYMITSGRRAVVADKIWERDLQRGSSTEGRRLALNPSAVRKLIVEGVELECVMSWSGAQSAAWIALKDLRGATAEQIRRASRGAAAWRPRQTSARARREAVQMRFRALGEAGATPDRVDEQRYVVPRQSDPGANRVGDYLGKAVLRRERPGAPGRAAGGSWGIERATGGGPIDLEGKRELYNVAMNLPKDRTPPVAIDVARPGDAFFVAKGQTFRREISLYRRTKSASKVRQTWVFGYVGRDGGDGEVADEKRRGWVPLRVLARP